jgi:spoIIIJ-associated protein
VTSALALLGYQVVATVAPVDDGLLVTLEGHEIAALIGRHGKLLDALEILLALSLQRQLGRRIQVTVDAAGYRARREKALLEQAQQAAERALAEGTAVALEPMEPRDRRIVHLALRDDSRISTASEGEGDHRHVVVTPGAAGGSSGQADDPE